MGCDHEPSRETIDNSENISKVWEIRKRIGDRSIGRLTIEDLIVLVNSFDIHGLKRNSTDNLEKLLKIENDLKNLDE